MLRYGSVMTTEPDSTFIPPKYADRLHQLYDLATDEVIDAIRAQLGEGKKPKRVARPQVSVRDNGMATISDPPFMGHNGPVEYSSVLEPPWGDDAARAEGKFPPARFPALRALLDFIRAESEVWVSYMSAPHERIFEILVEGGVEGAANSHFLRFGETASSPRTRKSVLAPVLKGLLEPRLPTPVVIPIALTRFACDRARLAEDALLIRMSEGLQRARWDNKAHAANGHDVVLASATHALVLTTWSIANQPKWDLGQALSAPEPAVTQMVDSFFAALRLELGIATGYAQEIRLAKGWRSYRRLDEPEVYAVGARRYPAWFDDYGWNADPLPLVDKDGVYAVARTWQALRSIDDNRFALALRRLNAAMTRDEPADAILDATIALEVLLGDGDGQSISWKLRMRAAALIGIEADREAMEEVRTAIRDTYEARSAIVHGGRRKKSTSDDGGYAASQTAIDVLRQVLKALVRHPAYLDPLKIDADLLLTSCLVI